MDDIYGDIRYASGFGTVVCLHVKDGETIEILLQEAKVIDMSNGHLLVFGSGSDDNGSLPTREISSDDLLPWAL